MRPRRRVISLSPRLSFDVAVQMSFYSVDTSILDAAVQQLPHSILSQDVFFDADGCSPSFLVFSRRGCHTPTRSTVLRDTSKTTTDDGIFC